MRKHLHADRSTAKGRFLDEYPGRTILPEYSVEVQYRASRNAERQFLDCDMDVGQIRSLVVKRVPGYPMIVPFFATPRMRELVISSLKSCSRQNRLTEIINDSHPFDFRHGDIILVCQEKGTFEEAQDPRGASFVWTVKNHMPSLVYIGDKIKVDASSPEHFRTDAYSFAGVSPSPCDEFIMEICKNIKSVPNSEAFKLGFTTSIGDGFHLVSVVQSNEWIDKRTHVVVFEGYEESQSKESLSATQAIIFSCQNQHQNVHFEVLRSTEDDVFVLMKYVVPEAKKDLKEPQPSFGLSDFDLRHLAESDNSTESATEIGLTGFQPVPLGGLGTLGNPPLQPKQLDHATFGLDHRSIADSLLNAKVSTSMRSIPGNFGLGSSKQPRIIRLSEIKPSICVYMCTGCGSELSQNIAEQHKCEDESHSFQCMKCHVVMIGEALFNHKTFCCGGMPTLRANPSSHLELEYSECEICGFRLKTSEAPLHKCGGELLVEDATFKCVQCSFLFQRREDHKCSAKRPSVISGGQNIDLNSLMDATAVMTPPSYAGSTPPSAQNQEILRGLVESSMPLTPIDRDGSNSNVPLKPENRGNAGSLPGLGEFEVSDRSRIDLLRDPNATEKISTLDGASFGLGATGLSGFRPLTLGSLSSDSSRKKSMILRLIARLGEMDGDVPDVMNKDKMAIWRSGRKELLDKICLNLSSFAETGDRWAMQKLEEIERKETMMIESFPRGESPSNLAIDDLSLSSDSEDPTEGSCESDSDESEIEEIQCATLESSSRDLEEDLAAVSIVSELTGDDTSGLTTRGDAKRLARKAIAKETQELDDETKAMADESPFDLTKY